MRCTACHSEIADDSAFCPRCGAEQSSSAEDSPCEYAAFISYRHLPRDQEVAKQVQKAIETFKMPRNVDAKATGLSGGGRIGKCFRDEDELAASHSLPDRILEALRKSSALIVVCTPDTRDSAWVQREISAFIDMCGRERVFAVLADGTSAESIPDLLRTAPEEGGSADHTSPLAADLRPEAANKLREETLRLIAGIAGCGYDELRQRDRTRRRKRIVLAAVVGIALVTLIAGAIVFASNARNDALIADSQRLVGESAQLLSNGDRYGAIEKALEALPRSSESNDRPYVQEAQTALENALEVNDNQNSAWFANYEVRTEAELGLVESSFAHTLDVECERASVIAISDSGGFFAVSDGDGNVCIYETLTGKKLADCIMPDEAVPLEGGLYARSMCATENYLVVANACETGSVLACFDAKTGNEVWSYPNVGRPSFDNSYGSDLVSMVTPLAEGGYSVVVSDLGSNRMTGFDANDMEVLDASSPYFNTPGTRLGRNYATFGGSLFSADLGTKKVSRVDLSCPVSTSLAFIDGLVIASSAEQIPDNGIERRYAIEAFDSNLKPIWHYDGTLISEMIINSGISSLLLGEPVIQGLVDAENDVAVSVGREVLLIDSTTGALRKRFEYEQTVVDARPIGGNESISGFMVVALSSGTVDAKSLMENAQDAEGDSRRLTLPFPIRWAKIVECGEYCVILAIPADATDRIVSFRTNWSREGLPVSDRSLDGLIALAHDVLAEGGRM